MIQANTPVGTPVSVQLDDGTLVQTQTVSEPYLLGGKYWVVRLMDVEGCYQLSRVSLR